MCLLGFQHGIRAGRSRGRVWVDIYARGGLVDRLDGITEEFEPNVGPDMPGVG